MGRAYHDPMPVDTASLREEANDLLTPTVELRRELHRWPEVGNELPVTQELVLGALDGLPLDLTIHNTTSGIAALLTGDRPGPTVLLRGDMDALPMHEDTGLDFASRHEGSMHACGHDTHTAMLAGAARCSPPAATTWPVACCSCSSPARRAITAPATCWRRACSRCRTWPTAASPVTGAFALHITSDAPVGMVEQPGGARSWRRPTSC